MADNETTYKQWLQDTADAIREKDKTTSEIQALTFPDRIRAIPFLDTSDATATDILSGKTAYVKGSKLTGSYRVGTVSYRNIYIAKATSTSSISCKIDEAYSNFIPLCVAVSIYDTNDATINSTDIVNAMISLNLKSSVGPNGFILICTNNNRSNSYNYDCDSLYNMISVSVSGNTITLTIRSDYNNDWKWNTKVDYGFDVIWTPGYVNSVQLYK